MSRNRLQRKLNKELFIKNLKKMQKEKDRIFDAICSLGWIELDTPIRDGWEREYILRDDYTRRSDRNIYEELLKLVNNKITCKNKSFMKRDYTTNKLVPVIQEPNSLSQNDYDKIPDRLKKYFYKTVEVGTYSFSSYKYERIKYKLIDTYMFVFKISKHYKTRVKLIDRNLESEYHRLSNFMSRNLLDDQYYDKVKYFKMKYPHDRDINKYDNFNEKEEINNYYLEEDL